MERVFKILTKTLSTVLVAVVIFLAVFLAGVRLIGLTPYTVLSGSMEPTYPVGSMIYVVKVAPAELKVRDPVTFYLAGDTIATHRIIEIVNEGTPQLSFRTQGDANPNADGVFPASRVVGKPVFSIPYLGYVSTFVQTPTGLICVVSCTVIMLLLSYAIEALFSKKTSESETEEEPTVG